MYTDIWNIYEHHGTKDEWYVWDLCVKQARKVGMLTNIILVRLPIAMHGMGRSMTQIPARVSREAEGHAEPIQNVLTAHTCDLWCISFPKGLSSSIFCNDSCEFCWVRKDPQIN